jgi:hypothetical protein
MKKCPFCVEEIPEDAKVCKFCSSTVVKKCPLCAEEIVATANACRFCRSEIPSAGAPRPAKAPAPARGPLGEERGVVALILLTVLTCGIYGLVALYKIGSELNAHEGKGRISPGVDLLLTIVTCGFWSIFLMYKYPTVLHDLSAEEGGPPSDVAVICLVLSIMGYFIPFTPLVGLAILQSELNKHWEAHRASGA